MITRKIWLVLLTLGLFGMGRTMTSAAATDPGPLYLQARAELGQLAPAGGAARERAAGPVGVPRNASLKSPPRSAAW